jgi:hypothetical protein
LDAYAGGPCCPIDVDPRQKAREYDAATPERVSAGPLVLNFLSGTSSVAAQTIAHASSAGSSIHFYAI